MAKTATTQLIISFFGTFLARELALYPEMYTPFSYVLPEVQAEVYIFIPPTYMYKQY